MKDIDQQADEALARAERHFINTQKKQPHQHRKTDEEIDAMLAQARAEVEPGAYIHHGGDTYLINGYAIDHDTMLPVIRYARTDAPTRVFVRPVASFRRSFKMAAKFVRN